MALNIKNDEVERLATEVASISGVSKTEAIRVALLERRQVLLDERQKRVTDTMEWLQKEVWPFVRPEAKIPMTEEEEFEIMGWGSDGV